jgi:Protein of unknown function (DUF1569)
MFSFVGAICLHSGQPRQRAIRSEKGYDRGGGLVMKNLFEATTTKEVKDRIARLGPDSQRQWGKMTAAQAMAHCSTTMEWAVGDTYEPRAFVGRIFGPLAKSRMLRDEKPLSRNMPTAKSLVVADERDLGKECARLSALVDRFSEGGPRSCTTNPHAFFGKLTPEEWARLMYKHLDHHLRQFGV